MEPQQKSFDRELYLLGMLRLVSHFSRSGAEDVRPALRQLQHLHGGFLHLDLVLLLRHHAGGGVLTQVFHRFGMQGKPKTCFFFGGTSLGLCGQQGGICCHGVREGLFLGLDSLEVNRVGCQLVSTRQCQPPPPPPYRKQGSPKDQRSLFKEQLA